jgi:threonine aldolase
VHTHSDGTLDLDDMKSKIHDGQDAHYTHTKLICLEQTHNFAGGAVLSLAYLEKVKIISLYIKQLRIGNLLSLTELGHYNVG